jgi:hypothetical protein
MNTSQQLVLSTISSFLQTNESAPSAYCLVKSVVDGDFSTEEADAAYERSEGENDTLTQALLDAMTSDQLLELSCQLLIIANEKLEV